MGYAECGLGVRGSWFCVSILFCRGDRLVERLRRAVLMYMDPPSFHPSIYLLCNTSIRNESYVREGRVC